MAGPGIGARCAANRRGHRPRHRRDEAERAANSEPAGGARTCRVQSQPGASTREASGADWGGARRHPAHRTRAWRIRETVRRRHRY